MQLPGKINRFVFFAFFFFILNNIPAQEVYDLSRCIKTGLERNFSLQVARNREEIAVNNYTVGNAGMLPSITMTNQFRGTVNTTNQNLRDGNESTSSGAPNNFGSAGIDFGMTIFRGLQVQNT